MKLIRQQWKITLFVGRYFWAKWLLVWPVWLENILFWHIKILLIMIPSILKLSKSKLFISKINNNPSDYETVSSYNYLSLKLGKYMKKCAFLSPEKQISTTLNRQEREWFNHRIFTVQSWSTRTPGLRIVNTFVPEEATSPPIRSGPISISAFWFNGSTSADFGPEPCPKRIILSIKHWEERRACGGAKFVDVRTPFEKMKRRWM